MIPGIIRGWTKRLGPPVNWDPDVQGQCLTLHVAEHEDETGPSVISAWQPTPEELLALAKGGMVYLRIRGRTMPPAGLWVGDPP